MLLDGSWGSLAKTSKSVSLSICRFRGNERENIPLSYFKTLSVDLVWLEIEPDQSLRNPRVLQPHLRRLKSLSVYLLAEVRSNERRSISTTQLFQDPEYWLGPVENRIGPFVPKSVMYLIIELTSPAADFFLGHWLICSGRNQYKKWSKRKEKNPYLIGTRWVHIHWFSSASFSC